MHTIKNSERGELVNTLAQIPGGGNGFWTKSQGGGHYFGFNCIFMKKFFKKIT
jgi:hypothetical protein